MDNTTDSGISSRIRTRRIHTTPSEKEILQSALTKYTPVELMRALTKGSLFKFIQYFWDTYSQTPFVPNWHIELICKEVETVIHRVGRREEKQYDLVINVPPGTTKTATVSIFATVWGWVNYPWMRYITSSHSRDLSNESAEYSRNIIRSEKFQTLFPELGIQEDKDVKSNFRVVSKEYLHPGQAPRTKTGGLEEAHEVGPLEVLHAEPKQAVLPQGADL